MHVNSPPLILLNRYMLVQIPISCHFPHIFRLSSLSKLLKVSNLASFQLVHWCGIFKCASKVKCSLFLNCKLAWICMGNTQDKHWTNKCPHLEVVNMLSASECDCLWYYHCHFFVNYSVCDSCLIPLPLFHLPSLILFLYTQQW